MSQKRIETVCRLGCLTFVASQDSGTTNPSYKLYAATGKTRLCIKETTETRQLTVMGTHVGSVFAMSRPSGSDYNARIIGQNVVDKEGWFHFAQAHFGSAPQPLAGDSIDTTFTSIISGDTLWPEEEPRRSCNIGQASKQATDWTLSDLITSSTAVEKGYRFTPRNYEYACPVSIATHAQRMIYLGNGYLDLATQHCKAGDEIFLLMGADMPFLLRPRGDGTYTNLSEAYVHGIMDGEWLVYLRQQADPTWKGGDSSWLQDLGNPPWPFPTQEVTLV